MLEGLEISEARYSNLERTKRIDSEFFNPKCLITVTTLEGIKAVPLASTVSVSDGNHFSISDEFIDDGIPYFRGQDVTGSFFMEQASPVTIPPHIFNQRHMTRSHIAKGDVLLSIVGTIGESALFSSAQPATCSCKLAILRPHSIPAEYLAVFLKSEHGRLQVIRQTRGAIQGSLLLEDMDQILVPRFSDDFERRIVETVLSAQAILENTQIYQAQAEQTLLRALGLENWQPPEPLTYTRRASEALAAGRIDSEYFAPRVAQLLAKLAADGLTIGDVAPARHEAFDPKAPQARPIPAQGNALGIRSHKEQALKGRLNPGVLSRPDGALSCITPEPRALPWAGIGQAVGPEASALASDTFQYIEIGGMRGDGTATTESITRSIRAAHAARQEAQSLLERAKRAVEIAIEEGEAAGMEFLKTK